jgi:outer membrane protein with beta-barrel domain
MKRLFAIALVLSLAAVPLAAQGREFVVSVYGGGADHLADLQKSPSAWFMPGYSVGASVGVQVTNTLGLHGDFTYTRNPVDGSGLIAGRDVNRFFYGVHAEVRYPLTRWTPYVFAGAGAVTIDQLGLDTFSPTTRPAVMYGGGLFYAIPQTRLEMVGEVKGLTYNWNMAGFHRNMVDVTYTVGLAYRFVR